MQAVYEIKGFEIDTTELIGQGSNGQVFLCKKLDEPHLKLCAKVIKSCQKDLVEAEITVLKKLSEASRDCSNVVKTYLAEYVQNVDKIVIIMELCETDLEKTIKEKKFFAEAEALQIFKQLVQGYKFIYENNIIHRDLKPANVLMQSNQYKIADFGEGKIIDRNQANKLTKRGSPVYQAPELFQSDQREIMATDKVDVFSLGIMFFEILYGYLPQQKQREKIYTATLINFNRELSEGKMINFPQEPKVSDTTKQLIEKMLLFNPDNRLGWEEIFKHQYFQVIVKIRPPIILIKPQQPTAPIIQPKQVNLNQQQPNNTLTNQPIINSTNPHQRFTTSIQPSVQSSTQIPKQPDANNNINLQNQKPINNQIYKSVIIQNEPEPKQIINPLQPQPSKIITPNLINQPNAILEQQNKQFSIIFTWIIDMQRIIEEKCNELLRGRNDLEIIDNLTKSLGNIFYYFNMANAKDEVKSISSQISKDIPKPINFKEDTYKQLSKHLQILQYHIVIDSDKKYSPDYRLFYRFLTNLSEKKYNFENPLAMSQLIEQDYNECGRKSQK